MPSVATPIGTGPVSPQAAIPCRTPLTGLVMAGAAKAMEGFSQEAHTTTGSARSQGTRRSVRNAESGRVGRSKVAWIASPCRTTWRLGVPTPFTGCGISRAILGQRNQTMLKSVTPPRLLIRPVFNPPLDSGILLAWTSTSLQRGEAPILEMVILEMAIQVEAPVGARTRVAAQEIPVIPVLVARAVRVVREALEALAGTTMEIAAAVVVPGVPSTAGILPHYNST